MVVLVFLMMFILGMIMVIMFMVVYSVYVVVGVAFRYEVVVWMFDGSV